MRRRNGRVRHCRTQREKRRQKQRQKGTAVYATAEPRGKKKVAETETKRSAQLCAGIQFHPHPAILLPRPPALFCSLSFVHEPGPRLCLLAPYSTRFSFVPGRRRKRRRIAAARRMSDRELRPLRSIRITGDGRCLFRSVAYGVCLRRGKQSPSESAQKELADELRAKVADEFEKRRGDTEWFLEGDFESYVSQMRKPHVWGGEPELLMCSHVLRMPITVYMYTKGSDSPRVIAEYGQEYGKDNPVRVLYDGYGHYDALQSPLVRTQSRLRAT